jgi:hypothetical protein
MTSKTLPQVGGLYEHTRTKKRYRILGVGNHSETLEAVVIYQSQYDDPKFGSQAIWVRPKEMFMEQVEIDGKLLPRFQQIEN